MRNSKSYSLSMRGSKPGKKKLFKIYIVKTDRYRKSECRQRLHNKSKTEKRQLFHLI